MLFRQHVRDRLLSCWTKEELNSLYSFVVCDDSYSMRQLLCQIVRSVGAWTERFEIGSRERLVLHRAWHSPENLSFEDVCYVRGLLVNRKVSPLSSTLSDVRYMNDPVRHDDRTDQLNITKFTTESILSSFNLSKADLRPGVLAYDIETDTSENMGLRPLSTVITDVSIATSRWCWSIAGREDRVLSAFADIVNEHSSDVLVGWNNHSFDDVTLQTRAQMNDLRNWPWMLKERVNFGPFVSSSVNLSNVSLSNCRTSTHDMFQVRAKQSVLEGRRDFVGLKAYSLSKGRNPRRENQAQLHRLDERRRSRYCLSDALMTLAAWSDYSSETVRS